MANQKAAETGPPSSAPPTAYDSFQRILPHIDDIARLVAAEGRAKAGGDESALIPREAVMECDAAQEYVEAYGWAVVDAYGSPEAARDDANMVAYHVHTFANHELHRRKTFWVDPPLAWMLAQTKLDIDGELLRLPFPACAFVFTDPETLAIAKELLTVDRAVIDQRSSPKVVTVYLQQPAADGSPRPLSVCAYLDRLTDDWPYLLGRDLLVDPRARIDEILDSHFPDVDPAARDEVFTSAPMKRLLHLVINAVLYATSAGVVPTLIRSPLAAAKPPKPGTRKRSQQRELDRERRRKTGEDVFFLPGKIDIRQVQQLQEMETGAAGRALMARFMVRGHWRRANATWEDQRTRWIEPYWKGPELAAVIEREYRLKT